MGIAKGVGMIEPDMATMLAFVFTDAEVDATRPRPRCSARVVDRTFNCLSVDTDTSTSDTAAILASGAAGPVDDDRPRRPRSKPCASTSPVSWRADGEGAETLIVVTVDGARDDAQAKRVAKAIVNSPLVKTAVHGADPNWGRIAMAIGKCSDDTDIDQRRGDHPHRRPGAVPLARRRRRAGRARPSYLPRRRGPHPRLAGHRRTARATVYGCDLTDGYVRINADYTT